MTFVVTLCTAHSLVEVCEDLFDHPPFDTDELAFADIHRPVHRKGCRIRATGKCSPLTSQVYPIELFISLSDQNNEDTMALAAPRTAGIKPTFDLWVETIRGPVSFLLYPLLRLSSDKPLHHTHAAVVRTVWNKDEDFSLAFTVRRSILCGVHVH